MNSACVGNQAVTGSALDERVKQEAGTFHVGISAGTTHLRPVRTPNQFYKLRWRLEGVRWLRVRLFFTSRGRRRCPEPVCSGGAVGCLQQAQGAMAESLSRFESGLPTGGVADCIGNRLQPCMKGVRFSPPPS